MNIKTSVSRATSDADYQGLQNAIAKALAKEDAAKAERAKVLNLPPEPTHRSVYGAHYYQAGKLKKVEADSKAERERLIEAVKKTGSNLTFTNFTKEIPL